jgi:hypothetical protein
MLQIPCQDSDSLKSFLQPSLLDESSVVELGALIKIETMHTWDSPDAFERFEVNTQNENVIGLLHINDGGETEKCCKFRLPFAQRSQDNASGVYDVFLSHKQEDAEYLAKSIKEYFSRPQSGLPALECFLDRDYRGDLQNLVNIISRSRSFLFILSRQILDSPWCMLELLSAVVFRVPIIFLRMEGHSMSDIGFPAKFEQMQFPEAAMLKSIMAIQHSRTYNGACMKESIVPRLKDHRQAWEAAKRASPTPATIRAVYLQFEELRLRRNEAFPGLREWESMGS